MTGPSTLPTDAERAQARAEHLAAIRECFELQFDGDVCVVRIETVDLMHVLAWQELGCIADLDEARAIRDRLAELIEDAETGPDDDLTPGQRSRLGDAEDRFDPRDLDADRGHE